MPSWSDGYITGIDYTAGFYPGLSPLAQSVSLLYRGIAAPSPAQSFAYCELGCGLGVSTALLAAANPNGSFWGVDFNPTHVARAEELRKAAGIGNVTFLERSFAEAGRESLPPLDYVALHGVWSWVGPENRKAVVDFIGAKLKPGGVVYVSYNALPGWAATAPLRQLLVERVRGQGEASPAAIETALAFAHRLRDAKAGYFAGADKAGALLDSLGAMPRNYVAHEYFNAYWSASYHSEVASELSAAKLVFGAPSSLADQMDVLRFTPEQRELLGEVADPAARETVMDYLADTRFRRDLFVRGARRLSDSERTARLRETRLMLTAAPPPLPMKLRAPVGEITIDGEPARSIVDMLAQGPRTVGEIFADRRVEAAGGDKAAFQVLALLLAMSVAAPALPIDGEDVRRESAARFNDAMMNGAVSEQTSVVLASPVLGTGVSLSPIERIFLSHRTNGGDSPVEAALRKLQARKPPPQTQESSVEPAHDMRSQVERLFRQFETERRSMLRHAGIS